MQGNNRLLIYIAIGVVLGIIGYTATKPNPPSAKSKPAAKKSFAEATDPYLESDKLYKAPEVSVTAAKPKDVFMPLVSRKSSHGSVDQPNAIPAEFAGGDSNWSYTGTGEIDSVPQALFENKTTGDAVYVQQGAHWKTAVVEAITPNTVLLTGPAGKKLLQLVTVDTPADTPPATAPLAPPMNGPIGGAAGTAPGAAADNSGGQGTDQAAATISIGGGGGGFRRGRGGRGGGRFGGRGGGGGGGATTGG